MDAPDPSEIVDLAFEVRGTRLPADYRYALWTALRGALPWLADEPRAGIHGIRTVPTEGACVLLARRAKLTLRLPAARVAAARALEGARIQLGAHPLEIGGAQVRALVPADTLYADFVATGLATEPACGEEVTAALARLGAPGRLIFGRRRSLMAGDSELAGFALAVHGLAADASLRLQREGLGEARRLGCGIFIRHKSIAASG